MPRKPSPTTGPASPSARPIARKDANYEIATRRIRWIILGLTALTFPLDRPQTPYVLGLLALAAIYNLTRYLPTLLRHRLFASPLSMLVVDNLFVATFLNFVGAVGTPYSAFLIFMVISAAYRYGLRALLIVAGSQTLFLALIALHPPFMPLALDAPRTLVIAILDILTVGLFVEQLTRLDRDERATLKRLGEETESERQQLLTLIDSLSDAIFVVDTKGRIIIGNDAAQELPTGQAADLRDQPLAQVLPLRPRTRPTASPVNLLDATDSPQHRRDLSLTRADGTATDLDIIVTPVQTSNRADTHYIIVCRDITKERSLDRQREEFIAVASHELRTPLTIVEAALSTALLSKAQLPPTVTTLIEQAHRNVLFLSGIAKDLTTLSVAQNDNLPISLGPVDAGALLRQLAIDFEAQAKAKNLPLQVAIAPDTPSVLSTENHIREILQNLLSNALKYTEKGHITLAAKPSEHDGVVFSIQDTGIGISATDQKHLFTKFYRAEDYRTRQTGGTGLGLYLCLELAERINGRLWCDSQLNRGSTFHLEVPPFSRLNRDHGKVVEAQVSTLVEQL